MTAPEAVRSKQWNFWWIGLVFFVHGAAPGFWIPALTNILTARGLGGWVGICFGILPICAMISPVIGGALADEKLPAQKLFAYCSLASAVTMALSFGALQAGLAPIWFVIGLFSYGICSGPTWGLLTTIALTNLPDPEKKFPQVRIGATFGWVLAGFLTSYVFLSDDSPMAGYASAVTRMLAALMAFGLPHTPPLGLGKSWKDALGFGGFALFRNRDHAVLLIVTGLFSIPLTAFYMYAPELYKMLGDKTPTATMTIAQWSEVLALLGLGFLMTRFRLKTLLLCGLSFSVLRYALSGYAGLSGQISWHHAGVALHGVCYSLYFITVQVYMNRRVEPQLRGQAQGMLALMATGIGPLIGSFSCAWLRIVCVSDTGEGWHRFWWILAGMIAACTIAFSILYKGKSAAN